MLTLSRLLPAPRTRAYAAFTVPGTLKRWWGPEGFTTRSAEIDARPGGSYRIEMRSPEGNVYRLSGIFLEVEPPMRLVFTWIWDQGPIAGHGTQVIVELRERGEQTELVLTHEGFPTDEARDQHRQGWTSSFDCLDRELRGARQR